MKTTSTSGGSAAQAGMEFQNRAAAWVAVHILAEQSVSPPWDLPVQVTLEFLRCETEQPVDDLLVGTSEGGFAFVQVKRRLALERRDDSALASTVDQYVRQLLVSREATPGRPWERPLDCERDRLVLLVGPTTSGAIRSDLATVLNRLRSCAPNDAIDIFAKNEAERRALSTVQEHVVRSWQKAIGENPSNQGLFDLLSLIYVHTLDVDEGGLAESDAKTILRTAILHNPSQADVAWATLMQACTGFASKQGGGDRVVLQRVLLNSGIYLKPTQGYLDDISKIEHYSRQTTALLSDMSRIRVGLNEVKIIRPSTLALKDAAVGGSVLVVGEPGAGKSGALHDLSAKLQSEGRDVVFLAVDRLEAQSLGALRHNLGLAHDLFDVLMNWHGSQSAFLIIDALDAARSDRSTKTLNDLISQVVKATSRWRVIASIRKFDLRYNEDVQYLFSGPPPSDEFREPVEFQRVRHVNIPKLTEHELSQIPEQSPQLATLVLAAEPMLHDMLRVPFNLRLMGELLGSGASVEDLTPIQTQIELLDRYWRRRILYDGQGDRREAVLRRATDAMVNDRALRVDRAQVADVSTSTALNDILSSQILLEWQPSPAATPDRYILTFAHHVLFDYTAARLLLRGDPRNLVDRLAKEPELVLAIRPSLLFHFQHSWFSDPTRRSFWKLVFGVIKAEGIPEVGKLIGPGIAAELGARLQDFEPLLNELASADNETLDAAERALRHLVGAIVASLSDPTTRLCGEDAGPWCDLLEWCSREMSRPVAYTLRMLMSSICEHSEKLTIKQRTSLGIAARRLLEFAWDQTPRDRWLIIHAMQAVCRTFESEPSESALLIRRFLEPTHLTRYAYEDLQWLAREVENLILYDPGLVEEIYIASFTHQEESAATTSMGQSRILALTSTRRQDYNMALYALAEAYPYFLSSAPEHATGALISALEAYVARRHPPASGIIEEETFEFRGREARIRTDYSCIWDSGDTYRHDEPIKMLDAFKIHMTQLVQDPGLPATLEKILNILAYQNRLAVLWRLLITCGTQAPHSLGQQVLPLAWAIPVLTCIDTNYEIGAFLSVVFPDLGSAERIRIEKAILSIPSTLSKGDMASREHVRNRLLGCLSTEHLVTNRAKQIIEELATTDSIPSNVPHFGPIVTSWEGPYGEREYLADEGVLVDAESNRRIQELEQPLKEFAKSHQDSAPTEKEIKAILPTLHILQDALTTAVADNVHPKQRDYAWGCLAETCERITACDVLSCEEESGSLVRSILLEAADYPEPIYQPEYDEQFDEGPSWGSPAARIDAAAGLIGLARHPTCTDESTLGAIKRLSQDPVPAVRFQIATRLIALYSTASDLMWELLERFCDIETSKGVLTGLLNGPLRQLATQHTVRVTNMVKIVHDRVTDGAGARSVRDACASIFLGLYLWRDNQVCRKVLFEIIDHLADSLDETRRIILNLRDFLALGPVGPSDPTQDQVRRRAWDLMERILRSIRNDLQELEDAQSNVPFDSWAEGSQQCARNLGNLADSICLQLYFTSGAYEEKKQGKLDEKHVTSDRRKRRFLEEAGDAMDVLAEFGYPNLVHHLLQTLEFLIPVGPEAVFLRIGNVVRSGERGGYQFESLAAKLIVSLIERYIAEYRLILRENEECQSTLLEILDVFVQAGWPSARQLTYRLEEIYR
jgi:hypothetical protein